MKLPNLRYNFHELQLRQQAAFGATLFWASRLSILSRNVPMAQKFYESSSQTYFRRGAVDTGTIEGSALVVEHFLIGHVFCTDSQTFHVLQSVFRYKSTGHCRFHHIGEALCLPYRGQKLPTRVLQCNRNFCRVISYMFRFCFPTLLRFPKDVSIAGEHDEPAASEARRVKEVLLSWPAAGQTMCIEHKTRLTVITQKLGLGFSCPATWKARIWTHFEVVLNLFKIVLVYRICIFGNSEVYVTSSSRQTLKV